MWAFAVALTLAALVVLTPLLALAGYAIVDQQGATTLVSRGRIKQISRGADQPVMVFDAGRDRLWLANPRTRSYWEGTSEEFCTVVKGMRDSSMSAMDAKMQEQLGKLPPEQRAMVAERMRQARGAPGGPVPTVTVEGTNEETQIGGLPARKSRVLANGQPAMDVWLGRDQELVQELMLAKAAERYGRLAACGAAAAGGPGSASAAVYESAEFGALYGEGWPLRVVSYVQGAPRTTTDVVRVEARDIPEAEFAPPAGFRKASLTEVFGATGRAPGRR